MAPLNLVTEEASRGSGGVRRGGEIYTWVRGFPPYPTEGWRTARTASVIVRLPRDNVWSQIPIYLRPVPDHWEEEANKTATPRNSPVY